MDRQARRAAVEAYKQRKPAFGIYAVICSATGEAWIGSSHHVDNHQNGLWFALKLGTSPHAALQARWAEHGEEAFRFEELDRLRDDFPETGRADELNKREALWCARLQATALAGRRR